MRRETFAHSKQTAKMEHPPVPSKMWELSLYELHRTPQEAITDNTEIAVSPRSLHSELMCPICLDMLKNTMTTKECLHRFCQDCIITALRSGNKECPTCRKKLVSKRSLRPDPNFDALISKIYPSREEYEAHQERVLLKLKQSINPNALSQSIEEGLRMQAMYRGQRVKKHALDSDVRSEDGGGSEDVTPLKRSRAGSEDSVGEQSIGDAVNTEPVEVAVEPSTIPVVKEIELVFKPHPQEKHSISSVRFIKTTANASVEHLAKYLAMRLALEHQKNDDANCNGSTVTDDQAYTISAATSPGHFVVINGTTLLEEVCEKYSKASKPLELFYTPLKKESD